MTATVLAVLGKEIRRGIIKGIHQGVKSGTSLAYRDTVKGRPFVLSTVDLLTQELALLLQLLDLISVLVNLSAQRILHNHALLHIPL